MKSLDLVSYFKLCGYVCSESKDENFNGKKVNPKLKICDKLEDEEDAKEDLEVYKSTSLTFNQNNFIFFFTCNLFSHHTILNSNLIINFRENAFNSCSKF